MAVPFSATSMAVLGDHDLSRDTSRELICIVEGETSLFSIVASGGMNVISLKNLMHQEVHTIPARNLLFLKVSYILE